VIGDLAPASADHPCVRFWGEPVFAGAKVCGSIIETFEGWAFDFLGEFVGVFRRRGEALAALTRGTAR
jgi:hypothetical protein